MDMAWKMGAAARRALGITNHGTIHQHSTPGAENGTQLLGRSFPLHVLFALCFFLFALWVWGGAYVEIAYWEGGAERAAFMVHGGCWIDCGRSKKHFGAACFNLRFEGFCLRYEHTSAIVKLDHGNPKQLLFPAIFQRDIVI